MHSILLRYTVFSVFLTLIAVPVWSNLPQQTYAGFKIDQYLTAEQLASWVLEVNPGLAAIQEAAEAAAYRIDPAGALDDPVLSYGIAPLTHDASRGVNQRFDVSQKIPWPGTLAARKEAARNDALAVSSEADMLQLLVITQTKAAYAEWHFIHEALNIHHATQALLDELTVATQVRYATGLATKQDALQAEVELNNLKNQELILLRQQVAIQAR
ncbi:MAG: TolC family protein, partial [Nitrosomonas sp.]|nr:TolC family protein [Nitrosomonas sp.]